jgi:hypothetical protein
VDGRRRLFILKGLPFAAPGGNAANAKHETDFSRVGILQCDSGFPQGNRMKAAFYVEGAPF